MDNKNRSLLIVHLAVAMFGSASLFGKLIDQPTYVIVAGRVLFSAVIMGIFFKVKGISIRLNCKKDYLLVLLMGAILAVHWLAFYHSVQISTVAIALLTFSTCPIFATFLEPLFFKERLKKSDVLVAIVAFSGVAFVVPKVEIGNNMFIGVMEGIFSGVTFALVSILERKYIKNYKGIVISFYEQAIVFIILLPLVIIVGIKPMSSTQIGTFMIFSIIFTLFSRLLYITGLKGVSAQTASIITCLEPLYGIFLAFIFVHEVPSVRELIGGTIILTAVGYSSFKAMREVKIKSLENLSQATAKP
ncbi:MAG: EamA family transporter [Lachnospiraceae bacterium]|nr:EamA family transporter [Lachnospiraceae bacterium]